LDSSCRSERRTACRLSATCSASARPDEVRARVAAIAEADGRLETKIMLPQDPAQAGADQAQSYNEMLRGYRVEAVRQTGSKELRAEPVAAQCNIGRIGMVKARWNPALIDELGSFLISIV